MKKHTLSLEIIVFFIIFILFIVSSFVFKPESGVLFTWNFPLQQIFISAFCTVVLMLFYEKSDSANSANKIFVLFPFIMGFGLLFCISLFCKALSVFLDNKVQTADILFTKPQNNLQWFFCIITFLLSAFNEEVIYRFYLSDKLKQLLSEKISFKFLGAICELFTLTCFALAHIYLGWISVLNAALAHIVLRVIFIKYKKLWPCVASHFLYNIVSLILL